MHPLTLGLNPTEPSTRASLFPHTHSQQAKWERIRDRHYAGLEGVKAAQEAQTSRHHSRMGRQGAASSFAAETWKPLPSTPCEVEGQTSPRYPDSRAAAPVSKSTDREEERLKASKEDQEAKRSSRLEVQGAALSPSTAPSGTQALRDTHPQHNTNLARPPQPASHSSVGPALQRRPVHHAHSYSKFVAHVTAKKNPIMGPNNPHDGYWAQRAPEPSVVQRVKGFVGAWRRRVFARYLVPISEVGIGEGK